MFSIYEVLPGIDVAFTGRWQLQLRCRASSLTTVLINGFWERHGFTGCGKALISYRGIASAIP
jgi:hypothetical protein